MDGMPISGRGQQCSTDKRYYGAFPDEKPTLSTLHALLRTLEKLEGEFRRYVEQSGEGPSEGAAPL